MKVAELEEEFGRLYGYQAESDAAVLLLGLGIKEDLLYKKMEELKESIKVKVLLASALFGEPDILLLDEPTNHLDAFSREELENTLLNYSGTMLIVSHDRYFINKLATRIVELTPEGCNNFLGNYDDYSEHRYVQAEEKVEKKKTKPHDLV